MSPNPALCSLLFLVVLAPATAAPAELSAAVARCAALPEAAARLRCYDESVAPLAGKPEAGVAAGRTATPEQKFGIRLPKPPDEVAFTEVTAVITGVSYSKDGLLRVELDNTQVWRQITAEDLSAKVGDKVTISKAALGSFLLYVQKGGSTRVRRIR